MNFRTTLLLLVLVLAVGATLFFTRDRTAEKEQSTDATTTEQHKLLDLNTEDVAKIAVTNSDGVRFALNKVGSDWKLVEPVKAAAKTFEVNDLVRALVELQSRGQVDASKKASGGLDHPTYIIELTGKADKVTKLSFGDKSPVGDSLYVQVDDKADADVVANGIYTQLEKPASNYRDTKLVTTSSDQIKQLAITSKGQTIKLEKQGDNWQITAPAEMPADTSAVSDLLTGITSLNATEFVDSPGSPAKYSLGRPRMVVSYSTQPAITPSVPPVAMQPAPTTAPTTAPATEIPGGDTIRFGGYQDILKKNVYASLNGAEVAIVPATSETAFQKSPLDLRNKEVATIDPDKVSSIRIVVLRKATTQPTTRPADTHEYTIDRRPIVAPILGPTLPAGVNPVTQPAATEPAASQPAIATTQPASTQADISTTQPASAPSTEAATQPSTEASPQPVLASTQPAPAPASTSTWMFSSGGAGDAEDGQVTALLDSFHPLKATKFIDPAQIDGDVYTVVVRTIPARAGDPVGEYAFNFTDAGTRLVGIYRDLTFEVDRSLVDKIAGDFKTKKPPAPAAPARPPMFPGAGGGGSPFGG